MVIGYCQGRAQEGSVAFVGTYFGALRSDGYVVHDGFDAVGAITPYACCAHACRYFLKVLASEGPRATQLLPQIKPIRRDPR